MKTPMTNRMRTSFHCILYALLMLVLLPGQYSHAQDASTVEVMFRTTEGDIRVELYAEKAPVTVANFLRYVEGGYFDGGSFYRTVNSENDTGTPVIEVIQGGMAGGEPPFPPIAHESTRDTGLRHTDGTLSMARAEAGTASSEFFIAVGDQPGLDYGSGRNDDGLGFAAFGRVIEGMEVVRTIHGKPADGSVDIPYLKGQMLTEPVTIEVVTRLQGHGETQ
ncbi:peptidylprolyl isomerase [Defluviimonas aestuarii]|uniref:peptidylprolyl isomerase n=1 Tax=Albidovulum aestuarii TaxID=1130726 RepID=UPI002499ED17|nr:peptidylprolyl isomerase [Defluviimonas aestuarii]MDI3334787.1 peptidylprolyl isomerase [Defluviimonas aestuarii]